MAYRAQAGNQVTVLHGLVDVAGTGFVTGQAAANWNLTVYDHLRVAQGAITPVVAEVGVTGWYTLAYTQPAGSTGIWTLEGTEPAGAAGKFNYPITVTVGIAASAGRDLTTLTRVKDRLFTDHEGGAPVTFDSLLAGLITEISNDIQEWLGRYLGESTYTEYHDGSGRAALILLQGPLVSVTGVWQVEYGDDGAGNRTETLTELLQANRLERNLRADGSLALSRLDHLGGVFTRGQKNWKVTYTGGFATLPEGLVGNVTDEVVAAFKTREMKGLVSKILDDGQMNVLSPRQLADARRRTFSPYSSPLVN